MPRLRVHNFSISLDGYAAGPDQGLEHPLGRGGEALHEWAFATQAFQEIHGRSGGADAGLDAAFAARTTDGIGATIMGRNMFGPVRGPWPDESWTGWWGQDPPFHHPVFVLTHHLRPPVTMDGGTVFHFTDEPIDVVLGRAFEAADGKDVSLGGGASTIQQYLRAGLVDEMHLAVVPVLLGSGERLFDNLGVEPVGYEVVDAVSSPSVVHVRLRRSVEAAAP